MSTNHIDQAVAVLHPTEGNKAHGEVTLRERGDGVIIHAVVHGLEAGSVHGIHVHEYGDCRAADATSAGGHYNPESHPHELPPIRPRHAGDLGNLTADASGTARYMVTIRNATISGKKNSLLGRAVIVHAKRDTGRGETGEAGARMACGVIGVANPQADQQE
jgi:Cu-Zn family superoxide dismutase